MPAVTPGPSAAQVFVEDLDALDLSPEDAHHLGSVLRLRAGEPVVAADGRGRWRSCTVASAAPGGGRRQAPALRLEPAGEIFAVMRPAPAITVAFALVKGERPEWAVQKLTEIGVDRIVLLLTERSVVRSGGAEDAQEADASPRVERLRRVAREAAMQSRRLYLPEITGVTPFPQFVAGAHPNPGAGPAGGVAVAVPGGDQPSLHHPAVAVGPEGGWAEGEVPAGTPTVRLGPQVLRTETAAVVAGTLLVSLRDGLVAATDGATADPSPGGGGVGHSASLHGHAP